MGKGKLVTKTCKDCGEEFEVYQSIVERGDGNFCSRSCAAKYQKEKETQRKEKEAENNSLKWSKSVAYLAGLITSDGTLDSNKPRVAFNSKDKSLVRQVKNIITSHLDVHNNKLLAEDKGVYDTSWRYQVTSRKLYYFLEDIGLMPNKSLELGRLNIPNDMFIPWLRGEIDGDGCWNKRRSDNLRLLICSGSRDFLKWISDRLDKFNLVNGIGNVLNDHNAYQLAYFDKDSRQIAKAVYKNADYFLQRKYDIVKKFI